MIAILALSLVYGGNREFALIITFICVIRFFINFSKTITILEVISLNICILYLVMPVVGYAFFTENNELASVWVKFMFVGEQEYFGYMIPAAASYFIGLFWKNKKQDELNSDIGIKDLLKKIKLSDNQSFTIGLALVVSGLVLYLLTTTFNVISIGLVGFFGYLILFPGFLYIYFNQTIKHRWIYVSLLFLFLMVDSISRGMFTVFIYMGATVSSLILIGKNISFTNKMLLTFVSLVFLMFIQNFKSAIRQKMWYGGGQRDTSLNMLNEEASKSLQSLSGTVDPASFFQVYVRMNQGFYVSVIQDRMPSKQGYSKGKPIAKVLLSSFVPRILWPDKPKSGGRFNMKHYANITLTGYAADVGPFGEAYGNFGPRYGCIYMLFLGLLINKFFYKIMTYAQKYPHLILWIPLFFYTITYSGENDTLAIVNWIVKSSVFVFVLYKAVPNIFLKAPTAE